MTYKAKSLIYLGVFASLAITYHLTDTSENSAETYTKVEKIKDATETNENATATLELEDNE